MIRSLQPILGDAKMPDLSSYVPWRGHFPDLDDPLARFEASGWITPTSNPLANHWR